MVTRQKNQHKIRMTKFLGASQRAKKQNKKRDKERKKEMAKPLVLLESFHHEPLLWVRAAHKRALDSPLSVLQYS